MAGKAKLRTRIVKSVRLRTPRGKASLASNYQKAHFKKVIERAEPFHKEEAKTWASQQDWEALKDEFEKRHKGKEFVYMTTRDFAEVQAEGKEEIARWIRKAIGPSPKKEIAWIGDWAMERTVEYSKDFEHTQMLKKQMEEDLNLYKVSIPVAGSYKSWQEEPNKIRQAVLEFLGGEIIQVRPEFKDEKEESRWLEKQEKRIEFYSKWMERIERFKSTVDEHYLNALGMNKPNMVRDLFNIIMKTGGAQGQRNVGPMYNGQLPDPESENGKENNAGHLYRGLMNMEIERSKIFDMPLPSEYQEAIAEKKDDEEVKSNGNGKHKQKVH